HAHAIPLNYTPSYTTLFRSSTIKHHGIGTQLLKALENKLHDQLIYVFTDSNCDYQFYLKKGFEIFDQIDVILDKKNQTPLTCFLDRKSTRLNSSHVSRSYVV